MRSSTSFQQLIQKKATMPLILENVVFVGGMQERTETVEQTCTVQAIPLTRQEMVSSGMQTTLTAQTLAAVKFSRLDFAANWSGVALSPRNTSSLRATFEGIRYPHVTMQSMGSAQVVYVLKSDQQGA